MLSLSPPLLAPVLAMAAFAFTGAITPGPVNVLALRHGLHPQRKPAVLFVLGASLSYAVVVWLTGLGMTRHLAAHPALMDWARWGCAAYLLWLAWRLANSKALWSDAAAAQAPFEPATRASTAFREGVLTQVLNPKAWLFALSAVGVFVLHSPVTPSLALGLLCAISLIACVLGVGIWALAGRLLLGRLQWLGYRRLNHALALLLAFSVLGVLR